MTTPPTVSRAPASAQNTGAGSGPASISAARGQHPIVPSAGSSILADITTEDVPHPPSNPGSVVEAANDDSIESDEFDPQEWDEASLSASASISSSIFAHTFENGRRYHSYKHGRYPIPNDDTEQNREDMKHIMMIEVTVRLVHAAIRKRELLNVVSQDQKLCYAPIGDNPQRILDIGTGTGIWAAGDMYSSAIVTGIDLSPIQPLWLPPNVKFLIDDTEDEWMNGDDWDLVHLRTMASVLRDIPRLCQKAFANIKPGGWMEWQEFHGWFRCDDGTMAENDPAHVVYNMANDVFRKMGLDINICTDLGRILKDVGFVKVQCIVKKIPVGPWARDKKLRLVGWYLKTVIQQFIPVLAARPFQVLGLNQVERELWKTAAIKALDDSNTHRYWNFYFWYGQKPE